MRPNIFFILSCLLWHQLAFSSQDKSNHLIDLPETFSPRNVSFHVKKHPTELVENYVFPNQIDELHAELKYIKQEFKQKFSIHVDIEVSLVGVENGGDHEPVGEYSFHKISFGKISKAQFQKLDKYYQYPLKKFPAKRKYDPNRDYSIKDFLLPKIQPLAGKTFFGHFKKSTFQKEDTSGEKITFIPNCWTTVHDILTSDQEPLSLNGLIYDFGKGGQYFIDLYRNSEYFAPIRAASEFQAYDVLAHIFDDRELAHTAVVIGPGIVFEKQAPGNEGYFIRPFRKKAAYEFFRMQKLLLLPRQLHNLDDHERFIVQFPAKVIFDKNSGFYVLDPTKVHTRAIQSGKLSTCDAESNEKGLCDNMGVPTEPVYRE